MSAVLLPLILTAVLLVPFIAQRGMAAVVAVAALLLTAAVVRRDRRPPPRPALGLSLGLGLFLAWAGVSLAWALDPAGGAGQWGQLAGVALCLLLLWPLALRATEAETRRVAGWLAGLFAAALAFLVVEGHGGLPVHHLIRGLPMAVPLNPASLNRATLTVVVLAWPAAAACLVLGRGWSRRLAVALVVAPAAVALGLDSGTAVVAGIGGLVAGLLGLVLPARGPASGPGWLAGVVAGGALAVWPAARLLKAWGLDAPGGPLPLSAAHRVSIWDFVTRRMAEQPLAGWGLGASRVMPDFGEVSSFGAATMIPLHPHNAYLQVGLELGLIGLGLVAALAALAIAAARRVDDRALRACVLGAAGADAAAMLTGYGAWQAWWLATLVAQAVLLAVLCGSGQPGGRRLNPPV